MSTVSSSSLALASNVLKYFRRKFRWATSRRRVRIRTRSGLRTRKSSASLKSTNSVAGGGWASAHMFSALTSLHYPRPLRRRRQSTASTVLYEEDGDAESLVVPTDDNARHESDWETEQETTQNIAGHGSGPMMQLSSQPVSVNGPGRRYGPTSANSYNRHISQPNFTSNISSIGSPSSRAAGTVFPLPILPPPSSNSSSSPRTHPSNIKSSTARRKPVPPPTLIPTGLPPTSPRQPANTLVAVSSINTPAVNTKPKPFSSSTAVRQSPSYGAQPLASLTASATTTGSRSQQHQRVPASLSSPQAPSSRTLVPAGISSTQPLYFEATPKVERRVSVASSNSATGSDSDPSPTAGVASPRFAVALVDPNQSSSDSAPGEMYGSSRSRSSRYVNTNSSNSRYVKEQERSRRRDSDAAYYKSSSSSDKDHKYSSYSATYPRGSDRERSDREYERDRERYKEKERDADRERERAKRQPLVPLPDNNFPPPREKARFAAPPPSAYVNTLRPQRAQSNRNVHFRDTVLFSPTPPSSVPPSPAPAHRPANRPLPPATNQPFYAPPVGPSTPHSSPSARMHPLSTVMPQSTTRRSPQNGSRSLHPLSAPQVARRTGWFNASGDQLWTNEGGFVSGPPGINPPEFADYPKRGEGWMNEHGKIIDMQHRLKREGWPSSAPAMSASRKESTYVSTSANKKISRGLQPLKSALKKRS